MFLRLLLLFTLVPLVELMLLVEIGRVVGLGPTLALVIATGIAGAWLAKVQGLAVLGAVRADLEAGRVPTGRLVDGLLILIAGAVLLTPGLLTDIFGFALLTPPGRRVVRRMVSRGFSRRVEVRQATVIDTEWQREEPDDELHRLP